MKKILIVVQRSYPSIGGTQIHSFLYAKELVKLGYKVDIVTSTSLDDKDIKIIFWKNKKYLLNKRSELKRKEIVDGIEIRRFKPWFQILNEMINPSMFIYLLFNIRKYDVIHTYCYMYAESDMVSFISLIYRNLKIIHSPQDLDIPYDGLIKKLKENIYDKTFGALTLHRAKSIIVLTEELKKRAISLGANTNKVKILPIGIDYSKYHKDEETKRDIDILFVGRLMEYKGAGLVIDTVNKIRGYVKVKCVIAGHDYGYKETLEKQIHNLKLTNVSLITDTSDKELIDLYNRSRFFVFPSRGEGFGGVVLEAIAGGCYPILLSEKGLKSLLKDVGGYPIFKDKDIPNQISDFLIKNWKTDFSEEVKRMQDIIKENYNWGNITKKLAQIYEEK